LAGKKEQSVSLAKEYLAAEISLDSFSLSPEMENMGQEIQNIGRDLVDFDFGKRNQQ
jgi:hypothetical protein